MIRRRLGAGLLAALLLSVGLGAGAPARAAEVPAIAAAADLNFALTELAAQFTKDTGKTLKLTFGSSGNFTTQIQQGAPFEMFLSADESYVQTLAAAGKTEGGGDLYAIGRLALFAAKGSPVTPDAGFRDLRKALADGRLKALAIANPDHAPYGRAAREALIHEKLWDAAQPRLVLGENASQATQFATTGSAQLGLIPYALALAPAVSSQGTYVLVPAGWHQPLRQRMVLIKSAGETTRAFYAYLKTAKAKATLAKYGFALPAGVK
jgi:molybdate transport system substrate-binding protein